MHVSSAQNGSRHNWRHECKQDTLTGLREPCSESLDTLGFVRRTAVPWSTFARHYSSVTKSAGDFIGSPTLSDVTVHAIGQTYRGVVTHFWLDLAFGICAVLLSAPHAEPVPVTGGKKK